MRSTEMRCNNSLSCLLVITLLDSNELDGLACNPCAHHSNVYDLMISCK